MKRGVTCLLVEKNTVNLIISEILETQEKSEIAYANEDVTDEDLQIASIMNMCVALGKMQSLEKLELVDEPDSNKFYDRLENLAKKLMGM